jgi:ActR/RegA family two-component response regulator
MSTERHSKADELLVYLIEDDEAVLHACAQAMSLADLTVRTCHSAEEALALLEDFPPDLSCSMKFRRVAVTCRSF